MSGNGEPQPRPGGGTIPPVHPGPSQPGEIPALPPALIAAPPGVDGAPLRSGSTPPTPTPIVPARSRTRRPSDGLGPAFIGAPAGTGARIAAFTLDAAAVILAAAIVLIATRSMLLAGLTVAELAIFLCVLEARTGLTLGNAVLRLRAARGDRPYSPGVGRQFVRAIITGAGFVVAVGSWVVVASSAWDRGGRRQSWADRVAGTVVVAVPPRAAAEAPPTVSVDEAAVPLAPPQVVPLGEHSSVVDEDSEPTDARAASHRTEAPAPVAQAGDDRPLFTVAPAAAQQSDAAAPASESGALLLIFDTGQRVQLGLPLAANLGRAPAASVHDDRLVIVTDPDSSVSKTHLRLEHSRGRTWVTDFGSTNGSDIRSDDGQTTELVAGERVLLDDADRVRIGNRSFTISLLLATDSSAGERA